ncbi:hypothetical protein V499_05357 [Pseudogymnoascus sp. VKM F-103]|uniref:CENP-V/GFA domain-containing protein n=1 Tax=Pseudogymnoascus verrucosus TaxID=342668 RepID=A0A1B8GGJ4_9PEZI|nr:uncharacterized protein VE01_07542 [Pseudogymnoascus verrucosus]KFY74610.1 hypothetical protein V499_05357 [Pseudogymnoascus sp. VKM F-103]OBT94940.1 hypothetical protein VE01_07542 [Pseudogymnoascus verrucosus]
MAALPTTPFTLAGGCFCKAVTYTVSVPDVASRPTLPKPPKFPLGPQTEDCERLPIISIDHCNSCRRIAGTVIQSWFICLQSWTTFYLLPRFTSTRTGASAEILRVRTTAEALIPDKDILETTYLSYFSSSKDVHRTFCGRCGTGLTYHYSGEDDEMAAEDKWGPYFDIALGTLDEESTKVEGLRPTRHGHCDDGIGWVKEMVELWGIAGSMREG